MEAITHLNVMVSGVAMQKLTGLEIRHHINEHAIAIVSGEVDPGEATALVKRADETQGVEIRTTAEGQPELLFSGVLSDVSVDLTGDYAAVTMTVKSYSAQVDHQRGNKSFQNTGETHESVINKVLQGDVALEMQGSDRAIGHIIVQCNETPWEFAMRMAADLGSPLVASAHKKLITVGIPYAEHTYDLPDYSLCSTGGMGNQNAVPGTAAGIGVKTMQYAYVGDVVELYGTQRVKGITASMETGILMSTISIADASGFQQRPIMNTQISGKMYLGDVMAVQMDKVQVHLVDIDSSYDGGGNVWLPYSTAYSSSDGSGFYCMPAVGDKVRVFFPGGNEGEAFAASSVCVSPAPKVTDKQWTGPNGKQILLTDEGIFITTNSSTNKIFINLTDEHGITISSDKNISICAKKNLSLISNDSISISARNDILISSAEAYIDVTPTAIEIAADNVVIK